MTNYNEFEKRMLDTCNEVANMMINKSKELNNGVSEITGSEAFEMAKQLVFKSYEKFLEA